MITSESQMHLAAHGDTGTLVLIPLPGLPNIRYIECTFLTETKTGTTHVGVDVYLFIKVPTQRKREIMLKYNRCKNEANRCKPVQRSLKALEVH